jgi:DNA invertase Pin-like site-specific DNA recombinase
MTETPPRERLIGYARVSPTGQALDAQLEQLKAEECAKIYREKESNARDDRRELQQMLKDLAAGDIVIVNRINRLSRSVLDLFAIVKRITDAGGKSGHWRSRSPTQPPAPAVAYWPCCAVWRT